MNWRPRFGRLLRQHSLRQRYLGVAVLLGCVVITSAVLTERHVSRTSQVSARNIEARNQIQQLSRAVRNAVWGAEYALHAYILTPETWYREAVESNLGSAHRDMDSLQDQEWIRHNHLEDEAYSIYANLEDLRRESTELMNIRSDIDRLFPSASLIDSVLSPANASFQTAMRLALDEIISERDTSDASAHQAFEDVRHSWLQMIGAFRLYVVRRAGIYSNTEQGLQDAGHDVELLLGQTLQQLRGLESLHRDGSLELQASESLREISRAAETWRQGFQTFRETQEAGHWRSDIPLIQGVVQPLFAEIWNRLDSIDVQLERDAEQDVSIWTQVGADLNRNLLFLSILALAFIGLGFVFFQRTVLAPLTQLTGAMKAIATSQPQARLPRPNSEEARDLTDAFVRMRRAIREREAELRHQALHDALTGLPNRVLIKDRLEQAILSAERGGSADFCLLMIDLDRFKEINDTLGHQAGDHVLCQVSTRLTAVLRKSDTVARLGGDEFAILLPNTPLEQARDIAQVAAAAIEQPLYYQDRELPIGASIGISAYPTHGEDAEALFKHADVAMYVAKQTRVSYSVYDVEQDQHSLSRLALVSELRSAIAEDRLTLHYQPKLDLRDGSLIGVEALVQWPKWRAVPSEYLVRATEKTSLIKPLSLWTLEEAARQAGRWRALGLAVPVSVNLSNWCLSQPDFDVTLQRLLSAYGASPNDLEFEITESTVMQQTDQTHEVLSKLHALGVKLSLDEYGSGFSSLAHLKTLALDRIKIDKSFVVGMLDSENDAIIVRSSIELAHNLGMRVVAEGVCTRESWDLLKILGCDGAQGSYIAHPMPAQEFEAWLSRVQDGTSFQSVRRA